MDHFCYLYLSLPYGDVCLLQPCSHLWERADLLALLYVMCFFLFYLFFVTFPFNVQGQVWHLMVSIPGICLLTYLTKMAFLPLLEKMSSATPLSGTIKCLQQSSPQEPKSKACVHIK